jgi:uncharacterized protein
MALFQWDPNKASANLEKHGVAFEEAATVFEDPLALTYTDVMHSETEQRWITVGLSGALRLLLVVNTEWQENIRIISARRPTTTERKTYESQF